METNLIGTYNMLEVVKRNKELKVFVDFSTSEVYGSAGITWGENVALRLLYGVDRNSQVLLLYPEELRLFFTNQTQLLDHLQSSARGIHVGQSYSSDQILLFNYRDGNITRQVSYSYESQGEMVKVDKLGEGIIRQELHHEKKRQHKMRQLLLGRHQL